MMEIRTVKQGPMHAKALLSGSFVTPPEALGLLPWRFTTAVRRQGRYRYLIILQLAPGLDDAVSRPLLVSMHQNMSLQGLQRGRHYQWGGLSVIGFRAKASAALFRLFLC